eukprot:149679_1
MAPAPSKLRWAGMLYLQQLFLNPIRTKSVTSFILMALQEILASYLTNDPIDIPEALKMGSYGALVSAPLAHYIMQFLISRSPGKLVAFAWLMFVNIPALTVSYMAAVTLLRGQPLSAIPSVLQRNLPAALRRLWTVYPLIVIFALKFVPPLLRVPFFQLVGFLMGLIRTLSMRKASKKRAVAEKRREQLASSQAETQVGSSKEE